jgi:cellulose synthase/poly-beta-1,6-N-acetylglucosamine synthase-like glycosyltransferase
MSIPTIAFILFLICLIIQMLYWIIIFSRVAFASSKNHVTENANYPISVIICGYNEGHNFQQFLPKILEQKYPNFEVIVVNDRSTDNSAKILATFEKQHKQLRVINLTDFDREQRGKKTALTQGLKAAKYEIVLLTDADCYPNSNLWIQTMANAVDANKIMGIAYVPFDKRPTFLNKFLRYDKIYIAIQYLSFALAGMPYMGAGANLIYRKDLFFKSSGFKKHAHVASGDDDLFVSEVANKANLAIVLEPESFIYCEPKDTFQQFYHQKSRHISTSWHYKLHHQLLLAVLAQSHFWLYVFAFIACFNLAFLLYLLGGIILRWLIMLVIFRKIAHRFDEKDMTIWLPLMDILYVFYYFVFALPLVKGNGGRWE